MECNGVRNDGVFAQQLGRSGNGFIVARQPCRNVGRKKQPLRADDKPRSMETIANTRKTRPSPIC